MEINKEFRERREEREYNEEESKTERLEESKKKRGRKKKGSMGAITEPKDQYKYFIDVSKDDQQKNIIQNLLKQANDKKHGREILLKDLVLAALPKLSAKDIEKIQESCLSEMEKVERALYDYNLKNQTNLELGEFLVRKLGIT